MQASSSQRKHLDALQHLEIIDRPTSSFPTSLHPQSKYHKCKHPHHKESISMPSTTLRSLIDQPQAFLLAFILKVNTTIIYRTQQLTYPHNHENKKEHDNICTNSNPTRLVSKVFNDGVMQKSPSFSVGSDEPFSLLTEARTSSTTRSSACDCSRPCSPQGIPLCSPLLSLPSSSPLLSRQAWLGFNKSPLSAYGFIPSNQAAYLSTAAPVARFSHPVGSCSPHDVITLPPPSNPTFPSPGGSRPLCRMQPPSTAFKRPPSFCNVPLLTPFAAIDRLSCPWRPPLQPIGGSSSSPHGSAPP
ncbi:hypothetical protein GOP47_0002221 [Adiantum capillus-veneris]|uniref:Uncharacterized protein n=1 Tax=Adiantum capillus-veneris TaxID=13818 RepID=A0A9D4ZNW2_ADICA|nr:hypothetical protein GOP47_0002221 [Adiantum capillus-veneris]